MTGMNFYLTGRGFSKAEFKDLYNSVCSIQESSLATEHAIWLGVDDVKGDPARMHLSLQMVSDLIPILQRFVDTGSLPRPKSETC